MTEPFKPLTDDRIDEIREKALRGQGLLSCSPDEFHTLCDMALASLSLPSPCGHPSQYAYSEDGGKVITCLLCERASIQTEELSSSEKQLTSDAARAIDLTKSLLREIARRHPVILQDTDIEAFIVNELNPAKVAANKDRTSCHGLMGLLAKARRERDAAIESGARLADDCTSYQQQLKALQSPQAIKSEPK